MKATFVIATVTLAVSCTVNHSQVSDFSRIAQRNFVVERITSNSGVDTSPADFLITYIGEGDSKGLRITTIEPGQLGGQVAPNLRCSDLNYAGLQDWRLPTAKEVHLLSESGLLLVGNGSTKLFPKSGYDLSFTERPIVAVKFERSSKCDVYKSHKVYGTIGAPRLTSPSFTKDLAMPMTDFETICMYDFEAKPAFEKGQLPGVELESRGELLCVK